jgi:hypothetical protein
MKTTSHQFDGDAPLSELMDQRVTQPVAPVTSQAARWLALGAVAGPLLGTLAWIVLGLLRAGYSPVRQQISALGIGQGGVFMDAAFMLTGLLLIVGVLAAFQRSRSDLGRAARWACTVLLLPTPLGFLCISIFTMKTLALHNLGAQLIFTTPIMTFLVAGLVLRRAPSWRRFGTWLLVGSPLTLALLIGFITSVPHSELVSGGGMLGLWERALATEVLSWYVALGWLAFRRL